jgi:hypothetical protein
MDGLYPEFFKWVGVTLVCVLPGIIAAAFGRGPWMISAAIFSLFAFLRVTPIGMWYFAWTAPPGSSFWRWLATPILIATTCACFAIVQELRKS